jgi:hypothetical protein
VIRRLSVVTGRKITRDREPCRRVIGGVMRARMFSGIIIGDDFFSLHVIRKRINHHCLFRQSWQFAGEWLNKDRGRGIGRFAGGWAEQRQEWRHWKVFQGVAEQR